MDRDPQSVRAAWERKVCPTAKCSQHDMRKLTGVLSNLGKHRFGMVWISLVLPSGAN